MAVSLESPASSASSFPARCGSSSRIFLYLGALGFGGPIALAGYMQRDLVERRRWLSSEDYVQGLALAQLAPGPLAAQLAIYLGWVRGRVLGATLVGFAFVLPSFLMVLCWQVCTSSSAAWPGCAVCFTASARRSSPSSRAAWSSWSS